MITITMTATIRPEVVWRTLKSFKDNLFKDYPCHLIMNIDPVGDKRYAVSDVANKAYSIFPNSHFFFSPEAHFSKAFKRVWMTAIEPDTVNPFNSSTGWIFNLEDDWELLRPVDLLDMIAVMQENPNLAVLRLPFFDAGESAMKNWNLQYPWNGRYFQCPDDLRKTAGFCGHPSLIRKEFIRNTAPLIRTELNPEKQFHGDNDTLVEEVLRWQYGVYGKPNEPKVIEDLGRTWMVNQGLRKAGNKAFFTSWEKA